MRLSMLKSFFVLSSLIFLVCVDPIRAQTPSISGVSPTTGVVGTSVNIAGSNFGSSQGSSTVTFNGVTATPTSWTATHIQTTVPLGATTGNIVVTVSGVASSGTPFTVTTTPTISGISPTTGGMGTSVNIVGLSFGSSQGSSTVKFNGTAATVSSWSTTAIQAAVPSGATTGNIVVTVNAAASNGFAFTVTSAPSISGASPTTGDVAASVNIVGAGFGSSQGSSTVTFNGVAATATSWGSTGIQTTVPAGATTGNIVVTVGGAASNGFAFAVTSAPSISGVSPTTGDVGESVNIAGLSFGSSQDSSTVTFNGVAATVSSWGATAIQTTVPAGATTGNIVVTVGGAASNGFPFTVTAAPTISGVSPTTGDVGTSVNVGGSSFGTSQGSSTVTFNGVAATVSSWGATAIQTTVPAGATTGNIVVTVGGAASNGFPFTVTAAPTISGTSPTTGGVGTSVLIAGSSFGLSQGTSTVTFNGVAATVTSWNPTAINVTVPSGAATGSIVVTVGGSASNGSSFTVTTTPSISGISPTSGGAGTSIYITGANFGSSQGTSVVMFNGTVATVTSWSITAINATVPTGATTGNIVVTVGGVATNGFPFTVTSAPSISGISPTTGGAGTSVLITGSNFGSSQGSSTVTFNGNAATTTSWSITAINAIAPSGVTTGNIVVTVGGVASDGSTFTVTSTPSISGISPTSGGVGTSVYIAGSNFGSSQGPSTVAFNGVTATPSSWSDTAINATVPAGATTGNILVTVGGTTSNGIPFTVTTTPSISGISPTSGGVGSIVNIIGLHFGSSQGLSTVSFNGVAATTTVWTDTAVTATVPSGATTGTIVLTVDGVATNGVLFTLTTGPSLVSVALSPSNPTIGVGGTQQFAATGTYSDGSTQDITSNAVWSSSNTSVAAVSNKVATSDPESGGYVFGIAIGTDSLTATMASISGSTTISVVAGASPPSVPQITGVTPISGAAATQVTIAGSGFGSAQGTGYVFIGSAFGIVVSWSDAQVVATVAPGSSSGIVQVFQAGQASNSVNFNVSNPTITSVTPISGTSGTNVTITGMGFGATQNAGQLWLGSTSGAVTSWSDTQVSAQVAGGAASGFVQILQNGVWSNAVPFTISTPRITNITPSSGPSGTAVTIYGSGFGASQGSGTVFLGSANGAVVSWSDSQVVANVANSSLSGIVSIQQDGISSNTVSFTVIPGDGSMPLTITPTAINMLVGDTHQIAAVNTQGQSVAGLTWTSSDTTIVSLSTDDPPILTAVAPGQVTLTAGNASAQITVLAGTSLPIGIVQWTNPGDGSGVTSIVPAVPSTSGVDVFAFQSSGNVAAVTTEGTTAWTAAVNGDAVPDFQGGLAVFSPGPPATLRKLDGTTGQSNPAYTYANPTFTASIAVHTDGTIFTQDGNSIVGIDPTTGAAKFSIPLEQGSFNFMPYCESPFGSSGSQGAAGSSLAIAGDGNAYLVYSYKNVISDPQVIGDCGASYFHEDIHLRVLQVSSSGASAEFVLGDWTEDRSGSILPNGSGSAPWSIDTQAGNVPTLGIGSIVTNADTGIVVSWSAGFGGYCAYTESLTEGTVSISTGCVDETTINQLTPVGGGGASVQTAQMLQPVLQRSDGTYIGYGMTDGSMVAFDISGNVKWSVPDYNPIMATSDGGVIAQSYNGFGQTTSTFDANGNVTGQLGEFPTYSWKGAYQLGSIDSVVPVFDLANIATTFAAVPNGNLAGNGFALALHTFGLVFCNTSTGGDGSCPDVLGITNMAFSYLANINNNTYANACDFTVSQGCDSFTAHQDWAATVKSRALNTYLAAFAGLPAIVRRQFAPTMQYGGSQNGQFDHTVYIDGSWQFTNSQNLLCPATGFTTFYKNSKVYYLSIMCGAQIQLGSYGTSNHFTPPFTDTVNFEKLITAIGTGIGNVAAHETGHQLAFKNDFDSFPLLEMDCGTPNLSCENNVDSVYEFNQDEEWNYLPNNPPIQWEPMDRCNLQRYLLNTNLSSSDCE